MAAWPSRMRMSLLLSKEMLAPVGNSPGPLRMASSTGGALLRDLPAASTTETSSQASSVPSVRMAWVLSASSLRPAGVPACGHSGGATLAYSLRYQNQDRLGIRK